MNVYMFGTKLKLYTWAIFLDYCHFCLPNGESAQEESLNWKGGNFYHPKYVDKELNKWPISLNWEVFSSIDAYY